MNLLLGVSSSIAAHRALDLASRMRKRGWGVRAVLTPHTEHLVGAAAFDAITGQRTVTSLWESAHTGEMDHLAVTKWADQFAIVPATANTLATLAHGMAADALGTFAVAWNKAPLVIAPAMNPEMYRNAAVQANIATLRARGHRFVGPVVGDTACRDVGLGRLAPVEDIEAAIVEQAEGWEPAPDLTGHTVLITTGPTREFADDVRFISNPSTGRMGFALAAEAVAAGARVRVVSGPVEIAPPAGLDVYRAVTTAEEMLAAVKELYDGCTMAIFAAAVSDWRPASRMAGKLKKEGAGERMTMDFVRNPDIALEASKLHTGNQVHLGFAAEASDLRANGMAKLRAKGFSLLFANPVNEAGAGFGSDTNHGLLLHADGRIVEVPSGSKKRLARRLLREMRG